MALILELIVTECFEKTPRASVCRKQGGKLPNVCWQQRGWLGWTGPGRAGLGWAGLGRAGTAQLSAGSPGEPAQLLPPLPAPPVPGRDTGSAHQVQTSTP